MKSLQQVSEYYHRTPLSTLCLPFLHTKIFIHLKVYQGRLKNDECNLKETGFCSLNNSFSIWKAPHKSIYNFFSWLLKKYGVLYWTINFEHIWGLQLLIKYELVIIFAQPMEEKGQTSNIILWTKLLKKSQLWFNKFYEVLCITVMNKRYCGEI